MDNPAWPTFSSLIGLLYTSVQIQIRHYEYEYFCSSDCSCALCAPQTRTSNNSCSVCWARKVLLCSVFTRIFCVRRTSNCRIAVDVSACWRREKHKCLQSYLCGTAVLRGLLSFVFRAWPSFLQGAADTLRKREILLSPFCTSAAKYSRIWTTMASSTFLGLAVLTIALLYPARKYIWPARVAERLDPSYDYIVGEATQAQALRQVPWCLDWRAEDDAESLDCQMQTEELKIQCCSCSLCLIRWTWQNKPERGWGCNGACIWSGWSGWTSLAMGVQTDARQFEKIRQVTLSSRIHTRTHTRRAYMNTRSSTFACIHSTCTVQYMYEKHVWV